MLDQEQIGFNAAVNILAVEFLIKKYDWDEYTKWINRLYAAKQDAETMCEIWVVMTLNRHAKNLGEMISQGDYNHQKEDLFEILERFD